MFHPSRGGTRGGKDQFSWEKVKDDKDRENYLGHSLFAPVGRWQKDKDLTWYAKGGQEKDRARAKKEELAKIKQAEEDAMAIMLGGKKPKSIESNVTQEELRYALKKDDSDDDLDEQGLGYGKSDRLVATGSNAVEMINTNIGSIDRSRQNSSVPAFSQSDSKTIRRRESSKDRKKIKKHKHKSERSEKRKHKSEKSEKKHRHERHHERSRERSHRHHRHHSRD